MFRRLMRFLFRRRCPHKTLGWPRYVLRYADATRVDDGFFRTCMDCGAKVKTPVRFGHRIVVKISS
jgi:hypothetical protein